MSQGNVPAAGLGIARILPVFTLAFVAIYFFGVYTGYGPIRYYPAVNQFHLSAQSSELGPVMMWYGWVVNGIVAGSLVSAIALMLPRRWFEGPPQALIWLAAGVPTAMLIALAILLRQYFLV